MKKVLIQVPFEELEDQWFKLFDKYQGQDDFAIFCEQVTNHDWIIMACGPAEELIDMVENHTQRMLWYCHSQRAIMATVVDCKPVHTACDHGARGSEGTY